MAENSNSKTEQPTNRKLSRAHDDGDVLQSNEVKTAAVIVAGLALVWFMAGPMMSRIERILQAFYAQADTIRLDTVESYTAFLSKIFSTWFSCCCCPSACSCWWPWRRRPCKPA